MDARDKTMNSVPLVPDPNVFMLSFIRRENSNYKREYRIYSTSSRNVFRQDHCAEVFFREEPDAAGNMRSPVATVFQSRASSRPSRSWRCRPRSCARGNSW